MLLVQDGGLVIYSGLQKTLNNWYCRQNKPNHVVHQIGHIKCTLTNAGTKECLIPIILKLFGEEKRLLVEVNYFSILQHEIDYAHFPLDALYISEQLMPQIINLKNEYLSDLDNFLR